MVALPDAFLIHIAGLSFRTFGGLYKLQLSAERNADFQNRIQLVPPIRPDVFFCRILSASRRKYMVWAT
jgi:hypothetical protein